jgi:hypothetical protein
MSAKIYSKIIYFYNFDVIPSFGIKAGDDNRLYNSMRKAFPIKGKAIPFNFKEHEYIFEALEMDNDYFYGIFGEREKINEDHFHE